MPTARESRTLFDKNTNAGNDKTVRQRRMGLCTSIWRSYWRKKPEWRLANLIMQRRARWLLGRVDELILDALPKEASAQSSESQSKNEQ